MGKRTASEVEALWPKHECYALIGRVAFQGITTPQEAAQVLQVRYDNGAAGEFNVETPDPNQPGTFSVKFIRDVPDDVGVVEDELLRGDDFTTTLKNQLRMEVEEGGGVRVLELTDPEFFTP